MDRIEPLDDLIHTYAPQISNDDIPFMKEFILWALVELKKLSKYNLTDGVRFKARDGFRSPLAKHPDRKGCPS